MQSAAVSVHPEVESRLAGLLERATPDLGEVERAVEQLETDLGIEVYASFLYLLCHLTFGAEEARSHWRSILEHHARLREKMEVDVDFRVAVLDYFVTVNRQLEKPKTIEFHIFQKTQNSAIRDELTGLYNYRYFRSELEREIKRAERSGSSLSLILIDIDHFKWYNDHNGRLQGDRALEAVGEAIRKEVRESDVAARCGGEEFAVLLPEANKPTGFRVAERIRERVASLHVDHADGQPSGKFTVSSGVATYRADAADAVLLIEAAESALYVAKGRGKNQVVSTGNEREFPRTDVRVPGKLQRVSSQADPLLTHNLSEGGLRFQCESVLQEGDFFRFVLMLPESGREVDGLARAVRCRRRGATNIVQAQILEISFENARTLKEFLDKQGG